MKMAGAGIGLLTDHIDDVLDGNHEIDWLELMPESYLSTQEGSGTPYASRIKRLRERYPLTLHCVSLSVGSTDPLDLDFIARLKGFISIANPAWISDHLCWSAKDAINTHELLPLPYTEEILKHISSRIVEIQERLGVAFLIENPSTYFEFTSSEMNEAEFLNELCSKSGCGLLLDINNLHVNGFNHGYDPYLFLDQVKSSHIRQIHLAGHRNRGDYLLDSHDRVVSEDVWSLYKEAIARFGSIPSMIEWDGRPTPAIDLMLEEVRKMRVILEGEPSK